MTPRMWCCDVLSWSGHTRLRSPVFPWPWSLSSLIPSLPEHRERFLSHSPRWWEKGSGDCHPFSALVEISLPKKNRTLSERKRMKTKPPIRIQGNAVWASAPIISNENHVCSPKTAFIPHLPLLYEDGIEFQAPDKEMSCSS